VEATPTGYREKGRFSIPDTGLPSWAHPVVSGGRLYVRNQDTVMAYDIKKSPEADAPGLAGLAVDETY
jgi:hypothetical protein